MDLSQKWALVTGASRGVGLRIARGLAEYGTKLILQARSKAALQALVAELSNGTNTVIAVAAELSDPAQVVQLIEQVRTICGDHLDILYNNAAIMTAFLPSMVVPASDYSLSFMVNVTAPAMLCDAFLPGMLQRNWGRIVNVTSGIEYQPELMAYSCSKAALDRYVKDMSRRLEGSNVLMNLLDPGWLRTDLGGPKAPGDPDSVLPGALVPVLADQSAGSNRLYRAQDYA